MRVLVISDTHGMHRNFDKVMERVGKIDLLLHLGDVEGGEYYIEQMAGCPVRMVAGNNDLFSQLPEEEEFKLGKYRVLMTHGHYYRIYANTDRLKVEAARRGVQIVMYGHTHIPKIEVENDVTILNPGSLSYPRQMGRRASYIIMELDTAGDVKYEINYL